MVYKYTKFIYCFTAIETHSEKTEAVNHISPMS